MKKLIFGMILVLGTTFAMANSKPITTDVALKNADFSAKIFKAIAKKLKPTTMHIGTKTLEVVTLPGLLSCAKYTVTGEVTCLLAAKAWKDLSNSVYSVINDSDVKVLYDALGVKAVREIEERLNITTKSIIHETPDQDGGTERNHLVCTKLGKQEIEMGLRNTCQLINAL